MQNDPRAELEQSERAGRAVRCARLELSALACLLAGAGSIWCLLVVLSGAVAWWLLACADHPLSPLDEGD